MSFSLDFSNNILNAFYKNPNYKILHGYAKNKKCYIFCSSNGLYYPNEYQVFEDTIISRDRYEFQSVAKMLLSYAEKIILIRDVMKQFYVYGINEKLNTIDKVADFLRSETEGFEIITAGGSAGGYMALALGKLLDAKAIYTTSAPVNLYTFSDVMKNYSSLIENKDDLTRNKYYNLVPFLKNYKIPVFYFYADECEIDVEQKKLIETINTIYIYSINSKTHGAGLSPRAWVCALNLSTNLMISIHDCISRTSEEWNRLIMKKSLLNVPDEKMLLTTKTIQKLNSVEIIKKIDSPKIIYGAGKFGSKLFDGIKTECTVKITDSDNGKKDAFGESFIDANQLITEKEINKGIILIAIKNELAVNEIISTLVAVGWNEENLIWTLI